jgi:hypothetical protein
MGLPIKKWNIQEYHNKILEVAKVAQTAVRMDKEVKKEKKKGSKMGERYIIYTMGNKHLNEMVERILGEKGYRWGRSGDLVMPDEKWEDDKYIVIDEDGEVWRRSGDFSTYRELTFRELYELPIKYNEIGELAEDICRTIASFYIKKCTIEGKEYKKWKADLNWCGLWGELKRRLEL